MLLYLYKPLAYNTAYARRVILLSVVLVLTLWSPLLHKDTAIKRPVSDRIKPSFVIFDIRTLSPASDAKKYKWRLNPFRLDLTNLTYCRCDDGDDTARWQPICWTVFLNNVRFGTGRFIAVSMQQWASIQRVNACLSNDGYDQETRLTCTEKLTDSLDWNSALTNKNASYRKQIARPRVQ